MMMSRNSLVSLSNFACSSRAIFAIALFTLSEWCAVPQCLLKTFLDVAIPQKSHLIDVQTAHACLYLPCEHIETPPHGTHTHRCLPCSHIDDQLHSTQLLLFLPCGHPLQYLHVYMYLLCGQMSAPAHSLHVTLRRLCSHMDEPSHFLHLACVLPCGQNLLPAMLTTMSLYSSLLIQ